MKPLRLKKPTPLEEAARTQAENKRAEIERFRRNLIDDEAMRFYKWQWVNASADPTNFWIDSYGDLRWNMDLGAVRAQRPFTEIIAIERESGVIQLLTEGYDELWEVSWVPGQFAATIAIERVQ